MLLPFSACLPSSTVEKRQVCLPIGRLSTTRFPDLKGRDELKQTIQSLTDTNNSLYLKEFTPNYNAQK